MPAEAYKHPVSQVVGYGGRPVGTMAQLDASSSYYYQTAVPAPENCGSRKRSIASSMDGAEAPVASTAGNQRTSAKLRTAARKPRKPSISSTAASTPSASSPSESGAGAAARTTAKLGGGGRPPPGPTEEVRRARHNHNLVEKQYRNRLNGHFERLIAVLPPATGEDDDEFPDGMGGAGGGCGDDPRRRLSKAEVLDLARRRIKTLERQNEGLRLEREQLSLKLGRR